MRPRSFGIFLRELRPFWTKADPDPLPAVEQLAKRLSVDLGRHPRNGLAFARVEAGLIRRRRALGRPWNRAPAKAGRFDLLRRARCSSKSWSSKSWSSFLFWIPERSGGRFVFLS